MKTKLDKVEIYEVGKKKPMFTIHFIMFDPEKEFIGSTEIKDLIRKERHISKEKVKTEYDTLFGSWEKVGVGRNRRIIFNLGPKTAANTVFAFPKKHRKGAFTWIRHFLYLPVGSLKKSKHVGLKTK